MNDTPDYIIRKQFEICNSRSLNEKITGLFDLTELSRSIILNRIRQKNPEMSESELKAELFKVFYKEDFDIETLNKIAQQIKDFTVTDKS